LVNKPKYYWDACIWIGLIRQETDKIDSCRHIIELAQKGEVEIWTSAFTLAEVYKRKCGDVIAELAAPDDQAFEDYLEQDYVQRVQVDVDIGTAARRLLRSFPTLGKPQDAIHVATAAFHNVDELHTFDRENLLGLNGKIPMANGGKLKICKPPPPPNPNKGTLFESLANEGSTEDEKSDTEKIPKSVERG
jgi:predicted nucleic acid-binding protein